MNKLQIHELTKIYPGVVALDRVSATFEGGKVNALIGKNGSGKSTLLKIINGSQPATSGSFNFNGKELRFETPKEALDNKIATVHQEMSLISGLTVAENIWIRRIPRKKGGFIDWKKTYDITRALLEDIGIDIAPNTPVSELSVWQMQMIEIAKAFSYNLEVLLLDEPTSALAEHETELLFNLVRRLKEKGIIIIYITHRLQELWKIADNCTVMRDGKIVGKANMDSIDNKQLVGMMFGNVEIQKRPQDIEIKDNPVLEVRGLTREPHFKNVSFCLKEGEILGIAGMLGSGRTELLRSIFGADKYEGGEILIHGERINKVSVVNMKKLGLALVPEDRQHQGLVQNMSIKDNLNAASIKRICKGAFVIRKAEIDAAKKQVNELDIKIDSIHSLVSSLSGGNQQKVVVGKWLNNTPNIMLFDEPSRGIDVNAKQQIFKIIWKEAECGISSIVVSSEIEELMEVCTRILIIKGGEIITEVLPDDLTVIDLYSLCMEGI